jgi:hypothetical protein
LNNDNNKNTHAPGRRDETHTHTHAPPRAGRSNTLKQF